MNHVGRAIAWAAGLAAAAAWGADAPDLAALRQSAAPHVCAVTAENALGLPLAHAAGFLFGDGRFAITDLATLAQPTGVRVLLRFSDGTTAKAEQFAMADPAIGLAAIRLAEPRPTGGLAFAAATEAGADVAAVGWRWAADFDVVGGRLSAGFTAAELAARLKIEAPAADTAFLAFQSVRTDAASGTPLLDRAGAVVGVLLQVAGAERPVVVPAARVRSALLSAAPQLKALADLPKPVWPAATLPMAGKPPTAGDFAQMVRAFRSRSRCGKCSGKGTVIVSKVVGRRTVGGITTNIIRQEPEACPVCKGEGVVFGDGVYNLLANMALDGTFLALAGDVDPKAREAVFSNAFDVLKGLSEVGTRYRSTLIEQAQAELANSGAACPRGLVVYAQVRDAVTTPDGEYTLLAPCGSNVVLAARTDRLLAAGEATNRATAPKPAYGHWLVLAGAAVGRVPLEGRPATILSPLAWAWGPGLGPAPRRPRPTDPSSPAAPDDPAKPKRSGSPDFFGVGG